MILSIFGCLRENVPKILVEISSFLFSKKTGFSMTAKTSLEMAEHLRAIFFSPLSWSTYSLVTCCVIGTENKCLFPVLSVIVFI
jgi:hypothetical protein